MFSAIAPPKIGRPLLAAITSLLIATATASAQVLLLDVTNTGGTTTFGANVAPYSTGASDVWNRGGTTNWGTSLQYSNGVTDTNIRVVVDALTDSSGTAQYNYAAPEVQGTANSGTPSGLFSNFPVRDGVYNTAASNVGYGGQSMRVTGLAYGIYDVYVVAAYIGVNVNPRPGQSSPASFNAWAFGDANADTLQSGTFGASTNPIANSDNEDWSEGLNYAKITVTLDELNPTLYIVAENIANDSRRGWLNAVQIVQVPEPGAAGLLGFAALGGLVFMRRRRSHDG